MDLFAQAIGNMGAKLNDQGFSGFVLDYSNIFDEEYMFFDIPLLGYGIATVATSAFMKTAGDSAELKHTDDTNGRDYFS